VERPGYRPEYRQVPGAHAPDHGRVDRAGGRGVTEPSWARQALDELNSYGGSDPHRTDELGDVSEIRIVADHDFEGGLYLLVLGTSPLPVLSWRVPPEFVKELQRPSSGAMLRCRTGSPAATLVTPPGQLPLFLGVQRAG
jgi:hypothetical protein